MDLPELQDLITKARGDADAANQSVVAVTAARQAVADATSAESAAISAAASSKASTLQAVADFLTVQPDPGTA